VKQLTKKRTADPAIESIKQTWRGFIAVYPKLLLICGLLIAAQQLTAQETAEIQNFWRKSYIQADAGKTGLGPQGEKAVWTVEKIANSTDVRLKHVASGAYLHAETDAKFPAVGAAGPGWLSAMWIMEPIAGTNLVRIKNKWRSLYLHTETGALEMGAVQPGWLSAQWQIYRSSSISTTSSPNTTAPEILGAMGSGTFPDQISAPLKQIIWRINIAGNLSKSMDAGKTWNDLNKKLAYVSAINNTTAWGINFEGKIELSLDGGITWRTTSGLLKQISGVDDKIAWGVNDKMEIYRTLDAGFTWSKVSGVAQSISAVNGTTAWALNSGNIWRTNNAGSNWSQVPGKMKSISAKSFDLGIGIDDQGNLKSTVNAGKSWVSVANGYFLSAVTYADNAGYAIDNNLKLIPITFGWIEKDAIVLTPAAPKNGSLMVFNEAGYVATIALTYTDAAGNVLKNDQIALGSSKQYDIPSSAKNIVLKVEGVSCIDPLSMEVKFASAADLKQCYKVWGTIFSTEWGSMNCF